MPEQVKNIIATVSVLIGGWFSTGLNIWMGGDPDKLITLSFGLTAGLIFFWVSKAIIDWVEERQKRARDY